MVQAYLWTWSSVSPLDFFTELDLLKKAVCLNKRHWFLRRVRDESLLDPWAETLADVTTVETGGCDGTITLLGMPAAVLY